MPEENYTVQLVAILGAGNMSVITIFSPELYSVPFCLFMAYFDLFLASTTCASLSANYDCASETDAIITGSTSLSECPSSCADVAYGRHGCCEWQADWKKCMFIPGVKSELSRTSGERHAIDCVSGGL